MIQKMFREMVNDIERVKDLYKMGMVYTTASNAYEQIDIYRKAFSNAVGGLYIFGCINDSEHNEAYDMLIDFEEKFSLFE